MRAAFLVFFPSAFAFVTVFGTACSSTTTNNTIVQNDGGPSATEPDEKGDGGKSDAANDAADGAPTAQSYPTDNIGWSPRKGGTRGNRIANLTFQGYRPNDVNLTTVTVGDFYDPTSAKYDALILVGTSTWDNFSAQTAAAIKDSAKRVGALLVLGAGNTPGENATLANLLSYRTTQPWATTALDSGFVKLGPGFNASEVPFVMMIDSRTMEIVYAATGAITSTPTIDQSVQDIVDGGPRY